MTIKPAFKQQFRSKFPCFALAAFLASATAAPIFAQGKPISSTNVFQNPGVYSRVVGKNLYEWIPTQDVTFEILGDGKVKLNAPLTKRSSNGSNECRRFIYDHMHKRLSTAEETALFGSGLLLPPGNYGFAILWINAASYDEVYSRPWDLMCNPDTYHANSAQVDYLNISVVPAATPAKSKGTVQEVMLPYDLQRVSWLPHYQLLPYDLNLPKDRGFGITRFLWDIPMEQVYRKVTHIQYTYQELDNVPASKKWANKQALDGKGGLGSNEWLAEHTPVDKDYIVFSEMDENFGNHGVQNHAERAQQVFEALYHRYEKELGVTSPSQTRIYDDYFSAMGGYDNGVSFRWHFNAKQFEDGLSNQTFARTRWTEGKWLDECRYFSAGAYKYRNWFQGGYLDSYTYNPEGIRIYNEIYNFEKRFAAIPDRKVAKFGWSNAEGVHANMYRSGTKTRLHFPNGDIIRSDVVAWPFHMMLNESFWTLLLANDYVLWHSNVKLLSDIHTFRDSWAAGAGKTKWQPTGGAITDFDPSNPQHPKRTEPTQGQFPNNPHMGESGAFGGAWLVSQLTTASDRTSKTIEYCPFSYKINGGSAQTGYFDSNTPKSGELGTKLSRFGVSNFGQANIVKSFEAKKPICIYTEGLNGGAVIYHNVYCGLTDVNEVTITTKSGNKTFTVAGNSLHVFYLNK